MTRDRYDDRPPVLVVLPREARVAGAGDLPRVRRGHVGVLVPRRHSCRLSARCDQVVIGRVSHCAPLAMAARPASAGGGPANVHSTWPSEVRCLTSCGCPAGSSRTAAWPQAPAQTKLGRWYSPQRAVRGTGGAPACDTNVNGSRKLISCRRALVSIQLPSTTNQGSKSLPS
jgi:hypothetical protein